MHTLGDLEAEAPQAGAALQAGHCCHVQKLPGMQPQLCDMGCSSLLKSGSLSSMTISCVSLMRVSPKITGSGEAQLRSRACN